MMGLDIQDVRMIQTEAQILGAKLESINSNIRSVAQILIELKSQQIKTNVLLEKIADYTSELVPHSSMTGPR